MPPSGAKGLNLAVGDARVLAEACRAYLRDGSEHLLSHYSEICLRRIWPTVHWSCQLSDTLHMFPYQTEFDTAMQYRMLEHWAGTELGRRRFRDAQLGLPYEI